MPSFPAYSQPSVLIISHNYAVAGLICPHTPFNPKPEAMAGKGMDRPHVAPAIASGFGLNEDTTNRRHNIKQYGCVRSYLLTANGEHYTGAVENNRNVQH